MSDHENARQGIDPPLESRSMLPAGRQLDHARVAKAMDAAIQRAMAAGDVVQFDLETDQFVIFSDQHKGARDGADDFQVAEATYNGALTYYNRMSYTLLTLGDVEELWEERPGPVLQSYPDTFALEATFHADGRYLRFWGNHDDNWRYPEQVERFLRPVYGSRPLVIREGILVEIKRKEKPLGRLFLVHGHQGTLDSDYFANVSRILVRYLWRPFQRLTRIPSNTPATNWRLRQSHNIALYNWSIKRKKMILIAGHTHRPVFESIVDEKQLRAEIEVARETLADTPADRQRGRDLDQLEEELAWIRRARQQRFALEQGVEPLKPTYYNTGCCCYPDGSITGLELVAGEIRLIRWNQGNPQPHRQVLARTTLSDVFDRC